MRFKAVTRWLGALFKSRAQEEFNIRPVVSESMEVFVQECGNIYQGEPYWCKEDDSIKTINFAKAICSEVARLTTLDIGIKLDGGVRADWVQKQLDKQKFELRRWVEYGCAYGTLLIKPFGSGMEVVFPSNYIITNVTNGNITGAVFIDREVSGDGKTFWKRLEYHRFEDDGVYYISNKCYKSESENGKEELVDIKETPWKDLTEEAWIEGLEKPLFGVLKMPNANNIDLESAAGMPIFAECLEELYDLDVAYSRYVKEIYDSKRTVLLDSDRLVPTGHPVGTSINAFETRRSMMGLPDYVRMVYGDGQEDIYHEINPTLNTETRITGINNLLSQIGYKVGFANGYFVFNEKSGIQTATGVEADQQRTVQFIKDIRDQLKECIDGVIYALDKFADIYGLAPSGTVESNYDFGDILYNYEEDKSRWYGYVNAGRVPFWYYLMKFEGMSEEDAKELDELAKAENKVPSLFGAE